MYLFCGIEKKDWKNQENHGFCLTRTSESKEKIK